MKPITVSSEMRGQNEGPVESTEFVVKGLTIELTFRKAVYGDQFPFVRQGCSDLLRNDLWCNEFSRWVSKVYFQS
jgi:hypothetical protein